MEKVEIEYSKGHFRNKLLVIFANTFLGLTTLIFGSNPNWIGYLALLIGVVLISSYAFDKGRKFHFVLENGILTNKSIFRTKEYILKDLERVEKSKDYLTLYWKDKTEKIYTHEIEEKGRQKLYSGLRFYISNS